jgi:hypothetical protein
MSGDRPQVPVPNPAKVRFAPADYSDGRSRNANGILEWRTRYDPEARKRIRNEAIYLALLLGACLMGIFWCLSGSTSLAASSTQVTGSDIQRCLIAWLGGTIGGAAFTTKWHYHSVAKGIWNEDRLLWRLFSPHVSGVLALFVALLIAGGFIRIFDQEFFQKVISIAGVSFLVGYFSDKALAKLAEVADTVFGPTQQT